MFSLNKVLLFTMLFIVNFTMCWAHGQLAGTCVLPIPGNCPHAETSQLMLHHINTTPTNFILLSYMSINEMDESTTNTAAAADNTATSTSTNTAASSKDTTTTTMTSQDVSSTNDADKVGAPLKTEEGNNIPSSTNAAETTPNNNTAVKTEEGEGDEPDEEEIVDEEDNLFKTLEAQQATESLSHINDQQPVDATYAPKLLQSAIQKGEVNVDDSEAESEEEHKKLAAKRKMSEDGKADEKKEEDGGAEHHHVHHRVSYVV